MKFSENWLRALVDIPVDRGELVQRLTTSGLEVASAEPVGGVLDGVVVARILACEPHPDADRLQVCRVDSGAGELRIVCGAPNARAGLVAPLATVGAVLPDGTTIKVATLRGVESRGMLCSARELGIDADASGLMALADDAPVGTPLAAYLGLPDAAVEVELTPNRGDCLGMLGLADEVAAEFGSRAKPFEAAAVAPAVSASRDIRLEAGSDCPRYLGRALRGIDMAARTPPWMAQRLRAAGVKPINAVVDVTNYVMLETGQPMHAFDEARLDGTIVVREARAGESLKLLDGSDAEVGPGFLLIADASKPLAIAGVMGGFDSRVTEATRDVFLEAAHFSPAAVMGRARKLGLTTDAAHRFERGVDPELPRAAIERATALLQQIVGGDAGEVIEAVSPAHLPVRKPVLLRRARISRVLGIEVEDATVERVLTALGMTVESHAGGWLVTPPSRRFDVEREEDLVEEVARIHGYDKIPARLPAGAPPPPRDDEALLPVSSLSATLAARDYHEAVCYAFVDPRLLRDWGLDGAAVPLANPLSTEMALMRTSLLPGLVDALARNRNRQQARVRLFESGVVFESSDRGPGTGDREKAEADAGGETEAPVETGMLAAVACGDARAEQWDESRRAVGFFDIKGDLEALTRQGGQPGAWTFDASGAPPWLHPGRAARVLRDGVEVGVVGMLHPSLQRARDLPETCVFEVRLDALRQRAIPVAQALPRFPSVRRDIAVEVDESVTWQAVATAIRSCLRTMLKDLLVFDCFRGSAVSQGRKSLAIGLILQDESRTLTDADVDRVVGDVVSLLKREFGARLRD